MSLFKNVNGIDVPMSDEEEAEIRAEWAANEAKAAAITKATLADSIINDPDALAALRAALTK